MTDKDNVWKLVPLERSYDMRAKAIIAFNTATANGADRDDALQAAWEAQFHATPAAAASNNAVVYPPDGTASPFTVINLGMGQVQMGDCIHDKRLPALWFGKEGKGIGHEEVLNREAKDGETIAVVAFANVEGLDVLLKVIHRIRRESFSTAPAPAAQADGGLITSAMVQKALSAAWNDFASDTGCYPSCFEVKPGKRIEADFERAEGAFLDYISEALNAARQPQSGEAWADVTRLLTAASNALRSYQYGNSSSDLAESIADRIDAAMNKGRAANTVSIAADGAENSGEVRA